MASLQVLPRLGPPYNNTDFINSFSKSFLAMVISGDPNVKFDPTDRTPNWKTWNIGATEMVFNETSTGQPEILAATTDLDVLKRCGYALITPFSFSALMLCVFSFWKSVAANIDQ